MNYFISKITYVSSFTESLVNILFYLINPLTSQGDLSGEILRIRMVLEFKVETVVEGMRYAVIECICGKCNRSKRQCLSVFSCVASSFDFCGKM